MTRRRRADCSWRYPPRGAPCLRRSSLRATSSCDELARSKRAPASSLSNLACAMRRGMIHGRFQPFHNGHLEYMRGAAERSDELWIGITNPDPERIKPEESDPLRHLPESNPFSYADRLLMVKAAAAELRLDPAAVHVIPFPVNEPELWPA